MSDEIKIVEREPIQIKNPNVIIGLPDVGLVGLIATMHMIETLKMKRVGYIESRLFPPVIVLHNGEIQSPIKIYAKDQNIAIVSEIPIPSTAIYELSDALLNHLKGWNPEMVILLHGIPVPNRLNLEKLQKFAIGTDDKTKALIKDVGVEIMDTGVIVGLKAIFLWDSLKQKIPTIALGAESFLEYPDPGAAASVVEALNKFLKLDLDVEALLNRAEELRVRMRDLMRRTQETMRGTQPVRELELPPMFG
ncbi:MAG: proteasome assembly chaperone family protein [Candidatus Helarchaeota archaeon]|nr:proteasome assembly chaperone family protein [Candidatus Helarchaeota archaeon]